MCSETGTSMKTYGLCVRSNGAYCEYLTSTLPSSKLKNEVCNFFFIFLWIFTAIDAIDDEQRGEVHVVRLGFTERRVVEL